MPTFTKADLEHIDEALWFYFDNHDNRLVFPRTTPGLPWSPPSTPKSVSTPVSTPITGVNNLSTPEVNEVANNTFTCTITDGFDSDCYSDTSDGSSEGGGRPAGFEGPDIEIGECCYDEAYEDAILLWMPPQEDSKPEAKWSAASSSMASILRRLKIRHSTKHPSAESNTTLSTPLFRIGSLRKSRLGKQYESSGSSSSSS
ncbi:hypothetical protein FIBSPDRAFT_970178 [Athelia psychrophila]|uniref:Uncharacterized protein n=1 Tax=Athelia psychrophila TaxID=1759441 RepID=A0A167SVV4_9AGAM|nr:hypothetical protein FIBSPDRAFT_970178 [Fibularhizoctonia sp. CBS 109695]